MSDIQGTNEQEINIVTDLDFEVLSEYYVTLIRNGDLTSFILNDDGDLSLSLYLEVTNVGQVKAYLPLKIMLISPSSSIGINFAPVMTLE